MSTTFEMLMARQRETAAKSGWTIAQLGAATAATGLTHMEQDLERAANGGDGTERMTTQFLLPECHSDSIECRL
jgi:hypothetical protein